MFASVFIEEESAAAPVVRMNTSTLRRVARLATRLQQQQQQQRLLSTTRTTSPRSRLRAPGAATPLAASSVSSVSLAAPRVTTFVHAATGRVAAAEHARAVRAASSSASASAASDAVRALLSAPWCEDVDHDWEALQAPLAHARRVLQEYAATTTASSSSSSPSRQVEQEQRGRGGEANASSSSAMQLLREHEHRLLRLVHECVPAASLLGERANDLLRLKMDQTGALGNDIEPRDASLERQCEQVLHAYERMLRRLMEARAAAVRDVGGGSGEAAAAGAPAAALVALWDAVLRKVHRELGYHVLQVRQTVDIERFSERFGAVATHALVPQMANGAR